MAAAATPDGTLLVAYVPPAHTGTITIDMTALRGTRAGRWFNPTTGTTRAIGTFRQHRPASLHAARQQRLGLSATGCWC